MPDNDRFDSWKTVKPMPCDAILHCVEWDWRDNTMYAITSVGRIRMECVPEAAGPGTMVVATAPGDAEPQSVEVTVHEI